MIRPSTVRIPMESIYRCSNGNRFSDDVSAETIERYFTSMESKTPPRIPSISTRDEKKIELDPLENFIRRGSYNSVLAMLSKGTKPESKHGMMAIKYGTDVEIFKLLTEAKMEITPSMINNAIALRKKFIYKWIFEKKRILVTPSYFDHLIRAGDDETCMEYIELRSRHQPSSAVDAEKIELTTDRLNLAIEHGLRRLTAYFLSQNVVPSGKSLKKLLANKDDDNFCLGLALFSNTQDFVNRTPDLVFCWHILDDIITTQRIKPILACINLKLPFNVKHVLSIYELREDIRSVILDSFYDVFYHKMVGDLLNYPVWTLNFLWIQESFNRCIDLQIIDEDYFLNSRTIIFPINERNREGRLNYYLKVQSYRVVAINKLKDGLLDGTDMCVDAINIVVSYLFRN